MNQVAGHAVFVIKRRTGEGKFLPGSSTGAGQYSTKPFAMPAYALTKALGNKFKSALSKRRASGPMDFTLFTSKKTGSLWVIVHGGYRRVRQMAGKNIDAVKMVWSGKYMRDLDLLPGTQPGKAFVGWKSKENQELANYHENLGAGKSKRLHKVLGLTPDEIQKDFVPFVRTVLIKKLKEMGFEVS